MKGHYKKNIYALFIAFLLALLPIVNSVSGSFLLEKNDANEMGFFRNLFYDIFSNADGSGDWEEKTTESQLDLLIITPQVFESELNDLKNHKETHSIKTEIVTTETIYRAFNKQDNAEEIKYCIKEYYDLNNISYVLLVGGLKGGFRGFFGDPTDENNWFLPGRFSYLDLDGFPEYRYLCDLYFADLYDDQGVFQTWNTDDDGRDDWFGEWRWESGQEIIDTRDLVPDVSVGRIPCRNSNELRTIVNKIIRYEENTYGQDWFNRMILVGGDSLDDNEYQGDSIIEKGVIEGKIACEHAYKWVKNRYPFENITLFPKENTEESDLNEDVFPVNFFAEQKKGSGFTYLVGHGSKGWWFNHPRHGDHQNFTYIRCYQDIYKNKNLKNDDRLPILVLDGCHLCEFNMNFEELFIARTTRCFGYVFLSLEDGGSIASIGNTAVCYGAEGTEYLDKYDGCLYSHFFEEYGNGSDDDRLGDYLSRVITRYVKNAYMFGPEVNIRDNILHTKCLESTVLLGDPSLKIGGYD